MKAVQEIEKLGNKIRALRRSRKFRLQDLAGRAGCTSAYISQIEKGTVSPSISVLKAIANALGVRLVDLFLTEGDHLDDIVVRRGEGYEIKYPDGTSSIDLLVKNLDGKTMEPLLKKLPPGEGSDGLYSHAGSQEFGYVVEGEFDLMVEEKVFKLRRGDSFYFNSNRPHGFINHGDETAEILWVISPPTY
jgi:transcriptional regulator with XRE-family HTH domain